MSFPSRRSRCGPGCLAILLALALWLPQLARTSALIGLGQTPPTTGLVVTTALLVAVISIPLAWRIWRHQRRKEIP